MGVSGIVAIESALISAGICLSWFRAPPPAPRPDEGPESLRPPCCGLAIHKKTKIVSHITASNDECHTLPQIVNLSLRTWRLSPD
ncbi:hypothetical protein PoB_004355000 [Plakobranchus ocellatus]|uniref:Secreted protein n=1 Tax=Plakobranchus ocellatus TaxID=259542 RepID=A0AAV4BBX5_9GAST|nr:hypothetical protein PoB_004355000 [Plakobranchus ocellatus]